jgi:endonuclease YncB( thermonuclease family)
LGEIREKGKKQMRFRMTNSSIFSLSITLLTNGEYVRLIGVDTPETKHPQKPVEYFGKEAFQFTKGMVEGKEVRLEYDQTRRDRYNRILGLRLSHGWNLAECRDHQAGGWIYL